MATKEEILANNDIGSSSLYFNRALYAMDEWGKQEAIEYANWLIDTFTTDEGRLPISGNRLLGGRTIYIDHEEYPFNYTYELFKQHQLKEK